MEKAPEVSPELFLLYLYFKGLVEVKVPMGGGL